MSQSLPSFVDCCTPCTTPVSTTIPGPEGPEGDPGTNGINGINSFTTADTFVMPDELENVTITVVNNDWMAVGQIVWAKGSAAQGNFEVISKPTGTTVELKNLEHVASGAYLTNSAPGTAFPNLTLVVPSGLQGPDGTIPAGALQAANNLSDVANPVTARTNLGLGSSAVKTSGVANGNLPPVDDATGLASGEALFATAAGVESKTAALARAALGLGTMATQSAAAVSIAGGAINASLGATTPNSAAVTTLAASGASVLSGNLTSSAKTFIPSSAIQSLLAATTVIPNATKIRVVGNGGAVTLTAVPTITPPAADGQLLTIMGTDNTNTVTFQRESALAGSQLRLGAASRVLGQYDTLTLQWDATLSAWVELAFTDNT